MTNISNLANEVVEFSRKIFGDEFIPLHRPIFNGNEREYLIECIDSNFVSSVGEKVTEFENNIADFTGTKYAIATVNGTSALHAAIELAGVERGDEVITQALTFIATCNAISYVGAVPVFVDVDMETLGMSPKSIREFLEEGCEMRNGYCYNKFTGKRISACIPMHTFGFPCKVKEISEICFEWNIALIEDAAESLGSFIDKRHTGTFSSMATLSFNGNKLITTGGGGMIITDDEILAKKAKHLTTTAKKAHPYEFFHDIKGYNYRLPNLNAALGCAQLEQIEKLLEEKRKLAKAWSKFFSNRNINFIEERSGTKANYWLNTICLDSKTERNKFLEITNEKGVMTRPIWTLMSKLPMFKDCQKDSLKNSYFLEDRIVNIPSSVPESVR